MPAAVDVEDDRRRRFVSTSAPDARDGPRDGSRVSSPAHVSKTCTARAPEAIWKDSTSATTSASSASSRSSVPRSRSIISLIAAKLFDPPPSTR
jgi:hypothetical protein